MCDRTRGNLVKLYKGRIRLDVREDAITGRVVKPWNRLLRAVVELPSLEGFRRCIYVHLGTRFSDGLGSAVLRIRPDDLKGIFQPKVFSDL